jgi:hypothetical protein
MAPGPARCSAIGVTNHLVAARSQLVDHLLTAVDRMDVHVAHAPSWVVETDPPDVTEAAPDYHGPNDSGFLRSRYEPREPQADAKFAAADVESGERPATDSTADERLHGESPEVGGVTDHHAAALVVHHISAYERPLGPGSRALNLICRDLAPAQLLTAAEADVGQPWRRAPQAHLSNRSRIPVLQAPKWYA